MKRTFKKHPSGWQNLNWEITNREDGFFPYITFKRVANKVYTIFCKELISSIQADGVIEFSFTDGDNGSPPELYISDYFFNGLTMKCRIEEFKQYYISDSKSVFEFICNVLNIPESEMEKRIFEQTGLYVTPEGSTISHLRYTSKKRRDFDNELKYICRSAEDVMQARIKQKLNVKRDEKNNED